jgi:Holliday junction DNA helicase RuvA
MIGRLRGTLVEKQPPWLLIDVGGVGYEVETPLSTFYELPEIDQPLLLLTHLVIKDDGHSLYGFLQEADRQLFRSLLKISGVGAKLALTILSGVNADGFAQWVSDRDTAALTRLPGIGKKTAERLVMEMKDRLGDLTPSAARLPGAPAVPVAADASSEAVAALQSLGYKPAEVMRMVRAVAEPDMAAEEIIRRALKSVVRS